MKNLWKSFFNTRDDMNSNTKIALSALLVAVFFVNNRFFNPSPIWYANASLAIVAVMLAAFIMGAKWAAIVGGLGDIVGALTLPRGGAYFFGFTFNWILIGLIFGLLIYRGRNKTDRRLLINMIIASVLAYALVQIPLASFWLYWMFASVDTYLVIAGTRAWIFAIVLVVQIIVAWPLCKFLREPIEKFLLIEDDEEDDIIDSDQA